MKPYRQGDVLLKKVNRKMKLGGKRTKSGGGERIVLAYGEATGHAHAIYDEGATLAERENKRFLEIVKPVALVHEEHDSMYLEPGTYEVIQQRQYHPEEIRYVAD